LRPHLAADPRGLLIRAWCELHGINTVEVSEELGRKGQEVREMTRDLDLLRADVDLIEMMVRLRGAFASTDVRAEKPADADERTEEGA
jgi:hypothetical protein